MSNLKRAFKAKDAAIQKNKEAQSELKFTELELSFAVDDVTSAICARLRLEQALSVIEYHREELKRDIKFSTGCAKVLISAYEWNNCRNDIEIASYLAELMPWLSWETVFNLIPHTSRYSSKEAADMMRVTLAVRQELGLTLFKASDLSDDAFNSWNEIQTREKDRKRADKKRRALNIPTIEERRAKNAAKKAYLEDLAFEYNISPATVRRRITEGALPAFDACKSEIRPSSSTINSADATFANDQARSEPNTLIDDTEYKAHAALALAAAASPEQKKTPTVSDRGQLKYEYDKSIYNTPQRTLEATVATAAHTSRDMKRAAFKPSRNASIININQRREKRARLFDLASAIFGSSGDDIARRSKSGK